MKSQQPGLENASTEILDPPDTISMATQLQQFLFKSMRKKCSKNVSETYIHCEAIITNKC